jgi:hypothetical protein
MVVNGSLFKNLNLLQIMNKLIFLNLGLGVGKKLGFTESVGYNAIKMAL